MISKRIISRYKILLMLLLTPAWSLAQDAEEPSLAFELWGVITDLDG